MGRFLWNEGEWHFILWREFVLLKLWRKKENKESSRQCQLTPGVYLFKKFHPRQQVLVHTSLPVIVQSTRTRPFIKKNREHVIHQSTCTSVPTALPTIQTVDSPSRCRQFLPVTSELLDPPRLTTRSRSVQKLANPWHRLHNSTERTPTASRAAKSRISVLCSLAAVQRS